MSLNDLGDNNIVIGNMALASNSAGDFNIVFGRSSLLIKRGVHIT